MTDQLPPPFQSETDTTQPPLTSPPEAPLVPPPTFGHKMSTVLKFVALGMLGVIFVVMLRFRSETLSATVVALDAVQEGIGKIADTLRVISSPKPSPKVADNQETSICDGPQFVYSTDAGVMYACQSTQGPRLIASGQPYVTWFNSPQFVDQDTISYVECFRPDGAADASGPHSCSLIVHDLQTEQSEKLVSYQSFANTANYHIGAEIFLHSWNSNGTQVVYLHHNYESNSASQYDSDVSLISLYDLRTRSQKVIGSLPMPAGRGTSHDDQQKVVFSPDDTKVLVQALGLTSTEITDSTREVTLLGVFDVFGNQTAAPLWFEPTEFSTFGSFISSEQIIFKQLRSGTEADQLVLVDLPTRTKTVLRSADGWYRVTAITPRQVLVWAYDTQTQLPVTSLIDFETSSEVQSWPGAQLIKVLSSDIALVTVYEACPTCDIGMLDLVGMKLKTIGLLDLKTGAIEPLASEYGAYVLTGDVWLP